MAASHAEAEYRLPDEVRTRDRKRVPLLNIKQRVRRSHGLVCGGLFLTMTAILANESAYGAELHAPFVVMDQRQTHGRLELMNTCEPVPAPIVNVAHDNPEFAERIRKTLYRYRRKLNDISDAFVRSDPPNPLVATCALDWLYLWAKHKALLGDVDATGTFVRKSLLAPVAMAYLKIKDAPWLDPQQLGVVRGWIGQWGHLVRDEYSAATDATSRSNHHLAEASWSVMAAAVATDDPQLFAWSVERTRYALHQVSDVGWFPWALERGEHAIKFQLKAVAPLVMVAEMAAANGLNLFDEQGGAMHRLVRTTVDAANNPVAYGAHPGNRQTDVDPFDAQDLAWLTVYRSRYPDRPGASKRLSAPTESASLGGDLLLLYTDGRARRAAYALLPDVEHDNYQDAKK